MEPLTGIGVDINYIAIVSLFLSFAHNVHIVYNLVLNFATILVHMHTYILVHFTRGVYTCYV